MARIVQKSARLASAILADTRGVSAVEFALIVPVLLVILAGVVDVSRLLWYQSEVTQSVRAGVQYVTANTSDTSGTKTVMVASTSLGTSPTYSADASQCACSTSASATLVWSPCSSLTCSATPIHRYVKLTSSYSWSPIFGKMAFLPQTVSNTVMLRVQ